MRAGIVRVALTTAAVALVLLGLPLGLAIRWVVFSQAQADLTRIALIAAAQVGPSFGGGDPVELPATAPDLQSAVYDTQLRLQAGSGPTTADSITRAALNGSMSSGEEFAYMVVAVPVAQEEQVIGVARAAVPVSVVSWRTAAWWAALAGAAVVSFAAAVLVARRQANVLIAPLKDLAKVSDRLRTGDLTARARPSGVPELDALAKAQNASADTITTLLDRERRYTSQVSHQLRTPLARMTLTLDSDQANTELGPVAEDLKSDIARLTQTVSGLLTFSRDPEDAMSTSPSLALAEIMEHVQADWHGALATKGRRLLVKMPSDLKEAKVPAGLAEQILGVLMDNAARHGSGTVTLGVRDLGEAIAIEVTDEGSQKRPETELFAEHQPGQHHGIGLPLARSLAQAHGGRLQLSSSDPTTFTWLLVTSPAVEDYL